ncbi:MAG TPA: UDP-glucose 4-epimerase GalE [Micromonosporaceae bacterium]|nr:UDP-glucose 4-epimerase GalE [Micromonosporaceae bacterium]
MKLLVTGGAGYIGSVVTAKLIEAGHSVVVLDDLSTGHADHLPADVEFHKLSVHEVGSVLTPDAGFDGVLHLAAKIAAGESVLRPDLYWETNVRGSLALLGAARAAGTPRLIFSSTGSVYSTTGREPMTEETPVDPPMPYAASKLMVDQMLAAEARAFGLGAVSLRYFNAAGAVGDLGERHDPETHLIPMVLQVAAGQRAAIALFGDDYDTPDGTCIRDYIHVADLASAHLLALEGAEPGHHKIYNLGNGTGFSNLQVIEAVRRVTGHPVPVDVRPRRPGDWVMSVASSAKARRELGWTPRKPGLDEIIGDAWGFHRRHVAG